MSCQPRCPSAGKENTRQECLTYQSGIFDQSCRSRCPSAGKENTLTSQEYLTQVRAENRDLESTVVVRRWKSALHDSVSVISDDEEVGCRVGLRVEG